MGIVDYLTARDEMHYNSALDNAFYTRREAASPLPLSHTFYSSTPAMRAWEITGRVVLPVVVFAGAALTQDPKALAVALAANAIYSTRHIGRYITNRMHCNYIQQSMKDGRLGTLTDEQEKKIGRLRNWF